MSRGGEVSAPFAGEERLFRLRLGELRQLQEMCGDVGPGTIIGRLRATGPVWQRPWLVDDVRGPILLGLVGAGMDRQKATRLVVKWLDEPQDWAAHTSLASVVILAAITGPKDEPIDAQAEGGDDPPGKATAGAPAGSPSPAST